MVNSVLTIKYFAKIIVLTMAMTITAQAQTWQIGSLTATLDDDGALAISGTGVMQNNFMPSDIDRASIKTVIIAQGVTTISDGAFLGCISLTAVDIPNSVNIIGNMAFSGCISLTSVDIPNSVETINFSAFRDCESLAVVTIGSGVSTVREGAFAGCTALTTVHFNAINCSDPTNVNANLFTSASLTTVEIGNNVKRIPARAFAGSGITEITIPDNVEIIGDWAFQNCASLATVTIGAGVNTIFNGAFAGCTALTTVYFNAINCSTIGHTSSPAFSDCISLKKVVIGNNVTRIPDLAFLNLSGLTEITIPNSVTQIGRMAFESTGLTEITIPNSVKHIDVNAFRNCTALTTVIIANGVTGIGNGAFESSGITEIIIPNSIETIGEGAFRDCVSLTSVVLGNGVLTIGDGAFAGCTALNKVNYNAVECFYMGSYLLPVFDGCISLATVEIGENVINIPNHAFRNLSGLTKITIPNSVTHIGVWAFSNCAALEEITNHAIEPPRNINPNVFENVEIEKVLLRISACWLQNYISANVWRDFNIAPDLSADLPEITITSHWTSPVDIMVSGAITENNRLTVSASVMPPSNVPLAYQWFRNTTNSNTGGTEETGFGAKENTFWIPTGLAAGTYYFYCEVSICGVSVSSEAATVMVQPIPVTDIISLIPYYIHVGDFTLSATVSPNNANQNIEWRIKDAGDTDATLENNILTTLRPGTVTVTAIIKDGTAIGVDFTRDIDITIRHEPVTDIID